TENINILIMATTTKKETKKNEHPASQKKATVKAKADAAKDLQELLEDGLKDIFWQEKELVKALPKMGKNTTSKKLKDAINGHLEETKQHVERSQEVFKSIGVNAEAE